jgi:hypothetical protein
MKKWVVTMVVETMVAVVVTMVSVVVTMVVWW